MLDDIKELRTFVSIVGAGSLSAAAREMDLALSVVSKRLAALERRTGTRLIARDTVAVETLARLAISRMSMGYVLFTLVLARF